MEILHTNRPKIKYPVNCFKNSRLISLLDICIITFNISIHIETRVYDFDLSTSLRCFWEPTKRFGKLWNGNNFMGRNPHEDILRRLGYYNVKITRVNVSSIN